MTKTKRVLRHVERWAVTAAAVTLSGMFFGATVGFVVFILCLLGMFLGAAGRAYKAAGG